MSRLGIGSSYGVPASAVEAAYHEYGVNYLYWGSVRRSGFGEAIRNLGRTHRDDLVVVVQTYSRVAGLIRPSVTRALGRVGLEYADILLLGMHNQFPGRRVLDAARAVVQAGLARHLGVSCHYRPAFADYLSRDTFDLIQFRYNAAHRGAEREIFPLLHDRERPGTVAYTATRWGHLLDRRMVPEAEAVPQARDCYRFVLTQPDVDVCLTGPANASEMRQALATLERGAMTPDELAWMCRVGDHVHGQPLGRSLRSLLWRLGSRK